VISAAASRVGLETYIYAYEKCNECFTAYMLAIQNAIHGQQQAIHEGPLDRGTTGWPLEGIQTPAGRRLLDVHWMFCGCAFAIVKAVTVVSKQLAELSAAFLSWLQKLSAKCLADTTVCHTLKQMTGRLCQCQSDTVCKHITAKHAPQAQQSDHFMSNISASAVRYTGVAAGNRLLTHAHAPAGVRQSTASP
jgi:hypothetical protein